MKVWGKNKNNRTGGKKDIDRMKYKQNSVNEGLMLKRYVGNYQKKITGGNKAWGLVIEDSRSP